MLSSDRRWQVANQLGIPSVYVKNVRDGRPGALAPWLVRMIEEASLNPDLGDDYRVKTSKRERRARGRAARESANA
jgi:hypothetical protein